MNKQTINVFGHRYFLLGKDREGQKVFLQEPSFDCGWYWGYGYLETFTNNNHPEKSKDITSHTHFNSTFKGFADSYLEYFSESVLKENEVWELLELMSQAEKIRALADMFHGGGAGISHAQGGITKDLAEHARLNKILEKTIFPAIEKLVTQ